MWRPDTSAFWRRKLCRNLERLDGEQELKLTFPPDQVIKNPEIVKRLNQGFEKLQKEKKKERGQDRGHGR